MKKLVYLLLLTTTIAFAQTSGITYQAVLYNPNGEELPGYDNIYSPLTDQQVCLHFSIIDQNGNLEYMEEATLMTDSFGMVNTVIGSHIQVDGYASGFNGILWDGNPKSLKVDLDIKGQCAMFEELSNQPFTYVPFALYSANPGNPGPQGEPGQDGVGIASTVDNNDGTFTLNFTDGSSFTTVDLTGAQGEQGVQGEQGPIGATGPQGIQGPPGSDGVDGLDGQDGVGIASTVDNNDGTFTLNFTDGSSFTTADLTGPQGAQGIQGEQGPIGPIGLTGPQGVQGPPGNNGIDGLNGQDGVGIVSTVDNNDGTFTLNYSDGSSFTTPDLTGPQGSGFNDGSITNQILYWSGNSWVTLDPGSNGQVLTICNGNLTWTIDGQCPPGSIASLDCDNTIVNGTITENTSANNVSVTISYTNGDGGYYDSQTLNSSSVLGLIATIDSGNFNSGDGNLSFNITGTPTSSGTAGFNINIGGQTCLLNINVEGLDLASLYPPGSIFCDSGPTEIVDVVNPVTGKVWMDRNLGASRAATSSTDALAYGDLYQWGRGNDGHQCRNSDTTSTLSNSDQPSHGNFIYNPNPDYNWRSPQNYTLWQGVNGVNNPCPSGYRLPTKIEFDNERLSWIVNGSAGAFNSPLKLPMAGNRHYSNGLITYVSSHGEYWTSKTSGQYSYMLGFGDTSWSGMYSSNRAFGYSIRCIKN